MEINDLKNVKEWETLKAANEGKEIVLLKKSPLSTVSFVGEKFFESWCGSLPENTGIVCAKVDVIDAKQLSNRLTGELNVKHESPQLIWLNEEGGVKWSGHHHEITIANLNKHLKTE